MSQNGELIPADNIHSAPEWRLVLNVQGELASDFAFGGCLRNSPFLFKHALFLCVCFLLCIKTDA